MRKLLPTLCLALALGCGKKPPPPAESPEEPATTEPGTDTSERDKLIASLKGRKTEAQRDAVDALATMAASDPKVIDALVELLRDRTNNGAGKINPAQINSSREAAIVTLLRCGEKGETAIKERGIAILRDGLTDKDAAVREHTAYALGVLGSQGRPLSLGLQKLCTDPDANVRIAAFDALRTVGIADAAQLAGLLTDKDATLRRPAAELFLSLREVPADAVPGLTRALDDEDEIIRIAAAQGIAAAAPRGASTATAEKLVVVIDKTYPPTYDPKTVRPDGEELIYWRALVRIGKLAVQPLTTLLAHKNPIVRMYALRALGEIGAEAKPSSEAINKLLADDFADVALEALCTLYRMGEAVANAERLVEGALNSTQQGVSRAAIGAVARMGPAGKPFHALALKQLGSPRPEARFAAIRFVGTLPTADAVKVLPELAKLTADPEELIRREVGIVLEKLGPAGSPAADAIGQAMLNETDAVAMDQFIDALVAMGAGAKPALPVLLPLVNDVNVTVPTRVKVLTAVALADPASKDVAATAMKAALDKEPSIAATACSAIGKLSPLPPDALAVVVKLAKTHSRLGVRAAAVRALANAGPKAKAARGDLEEISKGTLPGLALWAKVAIAAVDGDVTKAAATVRAGFTDKRGEVRAAAAECLPLVGPTPADVPILVKLLKESAPAREAAAIALGKIGPPAKEAVPRLGDLLMDKETDVRLAAVEALGRIGPAALPAAAKLRAAATDPLLAAAAIKALDRLGIKDEGPKQ